MKLEYERYDIINHIAFTTCYLSLHRAARGASMPIEKKNETFAKQNKFESHFHEHIVRWCINQCACCACAPATSFVKRWCEGGGNSTPTARRVEAAAEALA